MAYEWKNQVVLITGAATGIGAVTARHILEEEIKHVAVLDVDEAKGIELQKELNTKYGDGKVKFYKCDVTDEAVLLGIFDAVKKEQGSLDVVINNAGLMNDSPNVYKKQIDINVTALVTGTFKAIELMGKDKGGNGGTVINISSIAGLMQLPVLPVYFATKSAVLQFSNCIGLDEYYNKTGVRVLAICFGATQTPLLTAQKLGSHDPDYNDTMVEKIQTETTFQPPEFAAKGIVDAYKNGKSGTTWLVNASKPAEDISPEIQQGYAILSSKIV